MPFFGNKFSPKKNPPRKKNVTSREIVDNLVTDEKTVHLKLGEQELLFKNGEWIPETGVNSSTLKSNKKLRKKVQDLQEENNLLHLKYEIILNMLTQATAENHINKIDMLDMGRRNKIKN